MARATQKTLDLGGKRQKHQRELDPPLSADHFEDDVLGCYGMDRPTDDISGH